jgi:hypothetical protein
MSPLKLAGVETLIGSYYNSIRRNRIPTVIRGHSRPQRFTQASDFDGSNSAPVLLDFLLHLNTRLLLLDNGRRSAVVERRIYIANGITRAAIGAQHVRAATATTAAVSGAQNPVEVVVAR